MAVTAAARQLAVRRWRRWLKIIYNDVVHNIAHNRRLFREIEEMFQTNPALHRGGGIVWYWLAENYAAAAAVAVRRQADRGTRRRPVVSMASLLTEIAANPDVLTRDWFVGQYVRGNPAHAHARYRNMGNHDFDAFAARSTSGRISGSKVLSDRRRLRNAAAPLRHYVNKRIAHRALRGYRGAATFADLNAAIDELASLLQRYWLLLSGGGYDLRGADDPGRLPGRVPGTVDE